MIHLKTSGLCLMVVAIPIDILVVNFSSSILLGAPMP